MNYAAVPRPIRSARSIGTRNCRSIKTTEQKKTGMTAEPVAAGRGGNIR